MKVNDAFEIRACGVDGGVQLEATGVHREVRGAGFDDVALHVHLHQRRCGNFAIQKAVRIDEKMFFLLAETSLQKKKKNENSAW